MPSTSGGRKSKKRKIKNHDPAFDSRSVKKVLGLALRAGSGTFLYFREVRNSLRLFIACPFASSMRPLFIAWIFGKNLGI